jgi:hypothetical protein
VPRPYSLVTLTQYRHDTLVLDAARRALLRAAVTVLKVSPKDALGVFPVYIDRSSGWTQYMLTFPMERGQLLYEVDESERVIVLRSVLWGHPG